MTRLLIHLHDWLSCHRRIATLTAVVFVVVGVLLALRLRYKESITDFLPREKMEQKNASIYNALGNRGKITVILRRGNADDEQLMDAVDELGNAIENLRIEGLTCTTRAEESDALQAIEEIGDNIALYLTEEDYQRIDSLLGVEGYIDSSIANVRRMLGLPLGVMATDMITADPLSLFSPALTRLQQLDPSDGFTIIDGYLFDDAGNAYAFLQSPYEANDTRNNSKLSRQLDQITDSLGKAVGNNIQITAVGVPLIAATNATQIKKDSMVAMVLALLLIALLLWRTITYKRNIVWMGISVAMGWLFALAAISLFKTEISIIVIGIGSVLVGIAVNYPLHYIEHLKEHPDRRDTLKEMVQPLLTGNITTVAAFGCLVFVKAEAMRDLGLFASLMLVGTIAFTMIFLPLWAKGGRKTAAPQRDLAPGCTVALGGLKVRRTLFWSVVAITVVLGYFSKDVEFDSDLHNINFMTQQQKNDLALLSEKVKSDDLIYVVAEGNSLEEAFAHNDSLGESGVSALMPSIQRQEAALLNWSKVTDRHPHLVDKLNIAAQRQGISAGAFSEFIKRWTKDYGIQAVDKQSARWRLAENWILQSDTAVYVVNMMSDSVARATVESNAHIHVFSQNDIGATLVEALNTDFNLLLYLCSFVVFLFLWIALGQLELALLAFLPMAMGWLWILGLMALLGIKFNIVNIILATFIFGQGDDYTIFITEGLLYERSTGRKRLAEYRQSVYISAALMFVGIGTLILSRHPVMRSLAEVAMVGMVCVVMMACVVPPMVFRWLTTRPSGEPRFYPITIKRILITYIPIVLFSLLSVFIATPLALVFRVFPAKSRDKRALFHRIIYSSCRMGTRLIPSVKFKIEKQDESFEEPAVIVANHQSHLDLLAMLALSPKTVLLTKKWVWDNPIYALIIRYADFLLVDDGFEKIESRLRHLIEEGYSVVVFPEGSRSHDGTVGRFHKGAFLLSESLGLPILPVYIHGSYDVWPRHESMMTEGEIIVKVGERCHCDCHTMRQNFIEQLEQMEQAIDPMLRAKKRDYYNELYKINT